LWRRAQYAHVDSLLARLAHGPHGLLLDRAQELHLHVQRQVRDFVEEQRAAVCGAEEPGLVGDGTGEAALAVAEELALHQLAGDRAAVDGHEGTIGARPALVDESRDQFFAGAGLARDVYGRLAARDLPDHLPQALHGRRAAEQSRGGRRGPALALDLERDAHEPAQ
jgi:hypothetical protein